jgi:hypothetical protein
LLACEVGEVCDAENLKSNNRFHRNGRSETTQ